MNYHRGMSTEIMAERFIGVAMPQGAQLSELI
jgi:hypothetical protein